MVREPLRIALFTGNFNYTRDGATQTLSRLVDHLRGPVGADVRIYSPTSPDQTPEEINDLVSIPSVSLPGRPEYRFALGLTSTARQDLTSFAPHLVHLSTPDLLGFQAQRLARAMQTPVVASLHTRFETYFAYYGLGWIEPLIEQTLRGFYQRCDYVLVPHQAMAREMAVDDLTGRVRVWSRGVDGALFNPSRRDLAWRRSLGIADDEPVILFLGRVVMEKGLAVFADAVDQLRAEGVRFRVLVVGDGPARQWLSQRLPDAVFTGFLTGTDLARAAASADIFLNPSATEAFGNVTLEAMASGLAVVCADLDNSRALVAQGVNGLMCPPSDSGAYARAIVGLIVRPAARIALGRAARLASAQHAWSAVLDSVVDVYEEALDSAGRRGVGIAAGLRNLAQAS